MKILILALENLEDADLTLIFQNYRNKERTDRDIWVWEDILDAFMDPQDSRQRCTRYSDHWIPTVDQPLGVAITLTMENGPVVTYHDLLPAIIAAREFWEQNPDLDWKCVIGKQSAFLTYGKLKFFRYRSDLEVS